MSSNKNNDNTGALRVAIHFVERGCS